MKAPDFYAPVLVMLAIISLIFGSYTQAVVLFSLLLIDCLSEIRYRILMTEIRNKKLGELTCVCGRRIKVSS